MIARNLHVRHVDLVDIADNERAASGNRGASSPIQNGVGVNSRLASRMDGLSTADQPAITIIQDGFGDDYRSVCSLLVVASGVFASGLDISAAGSDSQARYSHVDAGRRDIYAWHPDVYDCHPAIDVSPSGIRRAVRTNCQGFFTN